MIENQKDSIHELEQQNSELKIDNERIREKYNVLKQKIRQRMLDQESTYIPINNIMQLQSGINILLSYPND